MTMKNYLVNLNGSWIDVRGSKVEGGFLEWVDPRDEQKGVAAPGEYIPFYPRQRSEKELRAV